MSKIWTSYEFEPRYTDILTSLSGYPKDKIICIMPCYNTQDTIKKAIESIINQTHTNWELIIVDDASTDKSVKIIKKYLTDSRVTLLQNKTNRGCYYSRNRALYHVKDKEWSFFTTHDADDTSTHDRFSIYINSFYQEKCEGILGTYSGKRWEITDDIPQIKYSKAKSSVGTSWYTYDTFKTFGYYYPNRFGSDSEYKERILKLISATTSVENFNEKVRDTLVYLNTEYAYTYTTDIPSTPSLTQSYTLSQRQQYAQECEDRHLSFTSVKDFYQNFEPHPEDITL